MTYSVFPRKDFRNLSPVVKKRTIRILCTVFGLYLTQEMTKVVKEMSISFLFLFS